MRRQTYGYLLSHKASPPIGWYEIILLGDRGTCVLTTCPGLHSTAERLGFELATYWSQVQCPNHSTTEPQLQSGRHGTTSYNHARCITWPVTRDKKQPNIPKIYRYFLLNDNILRGSSDKAANSVLEQLGRWSRQYSAESWRTARLPFPGFESRYMGISLLSMALGQCDARPTVTFSAAQCRRS